MNKNSKRNRYVILIVAIAVLLIVLALVISSQFITSTPNSQIKIPTITTTVQSSSDGSPHIVTADFSVDVSKKAKKNMSPEAMQTAVSKVIEKIDYDELNQKGSLEEVRNLVQSEIEQLYPNVTINKIYISNFLTDSVIKEPDDNKTDDRLKKFQLK